MLIEETVYLGLLNPIILSMSVFLNDIEEVIVPNSLTKVQLIVGDKLIDSALNPEFFDLTGAESLIISLGASNFNPGNYDTLILAFDANGGYYQGRFKLIVKSLPVTTPYA